VRRLLRARRDKVSLAYSNGTALELALQSCGLRLSRSNGV